MVSSGNWLTPHWNFSPWFEKPPLLMWITASFFSLFGVNEFWSRAVSALSGILLAPVTYLIGKKVFNKRVGILSAISLLSNPAYLSSSRIGMTDMMLSLFIYMSVLLYYYTSRDRKFWYGIGIFFSLAFITKFWAALVIPLLILMILIKRGGLRKPLPQNIFGEARFLLWLLLFHGI